MTNENELFVAFASGYFLNGGAKDSLNPTNEEIEQCTESFAVTAKEFSDMIASGSDSGSLRCGCFDNEY